jgi:hypothetical protein
VSDLYDTDFFAWTQQQAAAFARAPGTSLTASTWPKKWETCGIAIRGACATPCAIW